MGYATYQTGYRGEVSRREYRTLLACDIVPAVTVDGVPTSWKRIITVGNVTETVKEIVGLSYSDAHATGSVTGVYAAGCELFRKRMECAIMLQTAAELGEDGNTDL